ncbi:MAG TPA: chlorite dismutase family protein [Spirochaetia bacterium]|nr:chlorite dismutase family protein [Spirochaetia bacterium]
MADVVTTTPAAPAPPAPGIDLQEKGRPRNGEPQRMDRRLFVQLLVFNGCRDLAAVSAAMEGRGVDGVLYEDVNDPTGFGFLSFSEDPGYFLDTVRPLLLSEPFAGLRLRDEYTMLGRTYSMGWEADLEEALITRPRSRLLSPELPWVIWYPLRRSGSFEELTEKDQRAVLAEHGGVGQQYGKAGVAHDIRLACHGLSRDDNDFIIGILGSELYPLSAVVQRMRKTRQTSKYLARLGPFFIGRAAWQAPSA